MILLIVMLIVIGIVFTAFAALVFTGLTLGLGKISPHFELTVPEDWSFGEFYLRYLIIAAVFTFVALPLTPLFGCAGVFLGVVALTAAYRKVFDADWLQAIVIGGMGGAIAFVLFMFLLVLVLRPLGVGETAPSPDEFDVESSEEADMESFQEYDDSFGEQGSGLWPGTADETAPLEVCLQSGPAVLGAARLIWPTARPNVSRRKNSSLPAGRGLGLVAALLHTTAVRRRRASLRRNSLFHSVLC